MSFTSPELEDVLEDKVGEPFTKANFYTYLKDQFAEESLDFYNSVAEYKTVVAKAEKGTESFRKSTLPNKADEILGAFVSSDGEKMINVSGSVRQRIFDVAKTSTAEETWDKDIFDEAVVEVKNLLRNDPFFGFVQKFKDHNLNKRTSNGRKRIAMLCLLLGVITVVVFTGLEFYTDEEILDSPIWKLSSVPFFFLFAFFMRTGREKFCPLLNATNQYMPSETITMKEVSAGNVSEGLTGVVQHKELKSYQRRKAVFSWMKIVAVGSLISAITILGTPGVFY